MHPISDQETGYLIQKLGAASDDRFAQTLALAAVVALLPGTNEIKPEDAKRLITTLLAGTHFTGSIRDRAEKFADLVLHHARALADAQGKPTPSTSAAGIAPDASLPASASPSRSSA